MTLGLGSYYIVFYSYLFIQGGTLIKGGNYSRGETIDLKKVLTGDTIQGGTLFLERTFIKEIRYMWKYSN